jgi:hypothetical protein
VRMMTFDSSTMMTGTCAALSMCSPDFTKQFQLDNCRTPRVLLRCWELRCRSGLIQSFRVDSGRVDGC